MIRGLALLIASGSLLWSQSVTSQKAFLHDVDALRLRVLNGQPIDPLVRLQEELRFPAESADALLSAARTYVETAENIDRSLRRSILTRRLQVAGEYKVTYSSELDMVNWANLDLNLAALEQMDALGERLGEEAYTKLLGFIVDRSFSEAYFAFRPGETGPRRSLINVAWKQSPLAFWRDVIKGPLSWPESEENFVRNYKDSLIPPEDIVPYLEGTVVSVSQDAQGRKIFLAMETDGAAEAALLMDGKNWRLTREPEVGAAVRFSGVPSEFTREPFLILFTPQRITGLSVESTEPNPPFTTPGLDR